MSPELLDPEHFVFGDGRPTKESDSYAFGMVILEVLSGRSPFKQFRDVIVIRLVIAGKRPDRPDGPEGVWFTDDLWQTMNLCWEINPESRPGIKAVLECLERIAETWVPPSPQSEGPESDEDDWDLTVADYPSGVLS